MQFVSSRAQTPAVSLAAAIEQGLATDGGLYVPTEWPHLDTTKLAAAQTQLPELAQQLLAPFFAQDVLAAELSTIAAEAFNFPAPLKPLTADGRLQILQLFHGPTAAFKDFGARFLAASLTRLRASADQPLKILVATSGDTGGAVASAFYRKKGIEVAILFPKGLVSPTQERQLTCWGDNVQSFAVRGTFDDCQRLVKEAFLDTECRSRARLSSANSINLGRLLPQMLYYAQASLQVWREYGQPASFIIPSGNLGNAVACIWARQLGLPIAAVHLAHNTNRTVPNYLTNGQWQPRSSIATLASAMDVGNPSNFERLRNLYPTLANMREVVSASSHDDAEIRRQIRAGFVNYDDTWCPHTAVAACAYQGLPEQRRKNERWVMVATAHPAKFREIVEPIIGKTVKIPDTLAELFARPVACTEIAAQLSALRDHFMQVA
jgi:threonine synthase